MRRSLLVRFMSACAAVLFIASPLVSNAATKPPIEVGMAVALTGFLAASDGAFVDGAKLAVKALNDAGGMDGHAVNLHILDDASNATTGVTVTNQLLNQYNVSVMIGGLSSGQATAVAPIIARAKVPAIIDSELPPDPTWTFLTNIPHAKHTDVQLHFVKDRQHAKTIAILYSQTPYGQVGAQGMQAEAERLGMKVVLSTGVEGSVTDLTTLMAKVKDTNPDVVIDILTGATHIVETKAAETVGLKAPIIMTADDLPTLQKAYAAYPDIFFSLTAPQAYPSVPYPQLKAPVEKFLTAYRAAGLDPANILSASSGWDAVFVLARAVQVSGATGGEALRSALEKTKWQGANTLFNFSALDHSGQKDVRNPIQIAKLTGGKVDVVYSER